MSIQEEWKEIKYSGMKSQWEFLYENQDDLPKDLYEIWHDLEILFYLCDRCGNVVNVEDVSYDEPTGNDMCWRCYEDIKDNEFSIRDWQQSRL